MGKSFLAVTACLIFTICIFINYKDISNIPAKPAANTYVVDTSGLISPEIEENINNRISLLKNDTSSKLYIYITDKLPGYNPPQFLEQIKLTWGIEDNPNITAAIISLKDSKAYISSNTIDFSRENNIISTNLGLYIKQQGYENAVKFIFNTAASKISGSNNYVFNEMESVKQYKLLPYLITLSLILIIVCLAFFYFMSTPKDSMLINKNNTTSNLVLKTYFIKNTFIILAIGCFEALYLVYSINIFKLKTFLIFLPIFTLIILPLLKDTLSVTYDLISNERIYIEGTVDKVFHTYFRYYFMIKDTSGNSFLISSNRLLLKKYNYISAKCTKKIKHITELDMVYEKIVLN